MEDFLVFEPKSDNAFEELMDDVIGKLESLKPEHVVELNTEFAELTIHESFPPNTTTPTVTSIAKNKSKGFQCKYCGITYGGAGSLRKHNIHKHEKSKLKFTCVCKVSVLTGFEVNQNLNPETMIIGSNFLDKLNFCRSMTPKNPKNK